MAKLLKRQRGYALYQEKTNDKEINNVVDFGYYTDLIDITARIKWKTIKFKHRRIKASEIASITVFRDSLQLFVSMDDVFKAISKLPEDFNQIQFIELLTKLGFKQQ